jgi:hypothetical protein
MFPSLAPIKRCAAEHIKMTIEMTIARENVTELFPTNTH